MQDDVIICRDFKKRTEKIDSNSVVCGFVSNADGHIKVADPDPLNMWWSFPCIYIPNYLAKECAEWYYTTAKYHPKYIGYAKENKYDDAIFREFLIALYPHVSIVHLRPSLVDHIDYLIGGSVINKQRVSQNNRAAYFEDTDLVDDIKIKIKERKTNE